MSRRSPMLLPMLLLLSALLAAPIALVATAAAADSKHGEQQTAAPTFAFGRVGLYYREDAPADQAVMDFKWDQGPQGLRKQLEDSGFDVALITSPGAAQLMPQPGSEKDGIHVYVVPPANGPALYAAVEDMSAVSSFISAGGLVVLVEGNQGVEASKAFITQAMGYTGNWMTCRQLGSNRDGSMGSLERSTRFTSQFLPYSPKSIWVPDLEDVDTVVAHSWCMHEDPSFTSWPLYTAQPDRSKVVAQAFGKAGMPGALLWLGYTWRSGPQPAWGSLLAAVIQEFALRTVSPLGEAAAAAEGAEDDEFDASQVDGPLESLLEDVSEMGDSRGDMIRRFMTKSAAVGTYPPPAPTCAATIPPPYNVAPALSARRALAAASPKVLHSGTGVGTYYYDQKLVCPQDSKNGYKVLDNTPACSKQKGPAKQSLRKLGSNNVVAIDPSLLARFKTQLCGKKVLVFYNGTQVAAPDGGDFFVWDSCVACNAPPGGIDVSVSALKNAYGNAACSVDKVPCISWVVVDEVVQPYSP